MKNRAFRKFVASIGVAAMVMSTATNAMSPAVTRAESAQELEGQQNDSQEQGGQEDPVAQSSDDTNGAPFADAEPMAVSSEGSQDSQEAAGPSESSDSNGENGTEGSSSENTNASAGSTSAEASGAGSQDATGTMSETVNGTATGIMSGATNGTVGTTNSTITGTTNDTAGTINGATATSASGTSTDASTGTTTGENGEASGDNAEASTKEITSVITEDIDLGTYFAGEAPAYAQLELPDEIEVKVDEEKQIVTVTWNGEETYHPDQAGTYIFSSELDKEWNKDENGNARYQLAEKVELPKASVRVEKKAESTEDSKAEVKSDNKTENKTDAKLDIKEDKKTDAKADNKSEGKTEEKSDNKSEVTTKPETTKETTKDTSKENTKETSKKDSASKDKTKDETEDETKGEAKNEAKEENKTDTKDETTKADQKKKVTNAASLKAVYVAEDGTILCGTVGLTGDSFTISDKAKSFNGYELKTVTLGEEELPQDTAFTRNTSTTETKEEIRTEASYTYTMDGAEHEIAAGDTATITFTYAQKEEVTPEIASIEVTGEAVDTTGAAIQGDYAFPLAVGTNDLSKTVPYIQGYEYQYAEIGTDKITSIDKEVLEAGKYAYYVDGELLKENTKITYVYQEDEDYTEQLTGTCGNLTVTVSAKKDAKIPEGTIVRVSPIESARMSQIMAKISETLGQDPDNVIGVLYDISLDKDGEEIQPKESVHVTMKFDGGIPWNVPEGKQIADTKVVHMHGGETDVVAEAAEDGNAEFETESFSTYGMMATYGLTRSSSYSVDPTALDLTRIVKEGGISVVVTENNIKRDATVNFNLTFDVSDDKLANVVKTENGSVIHNVWEYDLTDFMKTNPLMNLAKDGEGVVYDGTEQAGSYEVMGDKLRLTISPEWLNKKKNNVSGGFSFKAGLKSEEIGTKDKTDLEFPGTGKVTTITYEKVVVSNQKTAGKDEWNGNSWTDGKKQSVQKNEDGSYTIYYKVETQTNAALDFLILHDTVSDGQIINSESVKVYKDNNSNSLLAGVQSKVEGKSLTVELPKSGTKIPAGTYTVKYTTTVSADQVDNALTNSARWSFDGNGKSDEGKTNFKIKKELKVQKEVTEGKDEQGHTKYTYTITIGDGSYNLGGHVIKDWMSDNQSLTGDFTISSADNNIPSDLTSDKLKATMGEKLKNDVYTDDSDQLFNYTFPNEFNGKGPVTITYSTIVDGSKKGNLSGKKTIWNKTTDDHDDDHGEDSKSSEYDFGEKQSKGSIAKTGVEIDSSDPSNKLARWSIVVTIDPSVKLPADITIYNNGWWDSRYFYGDNPNNGDNGKNNLSIDWDSIEVTGQEKGKDYSIDSATRKIIFNGYKDESKKIEIKLATKLGNAALINEKGEELRVYNKACLKIGENDIANADATLKYVSNEYEFSKSVEYDKEQDIYKWTVKINPGKAHIDPDKRAIFKDTLPAGMKLVPGSLRVSYSGTDTNSASWNGTATFNDMVSLDGSEIDLSDSNLTNWDTAPCGISGICYMISYQTKLTDEEKAATRNVNSEKVYRNTASVKGQGDTEWKNASAEVDRKYDILTKKDISPENLSDSTKNVISYEIHINKEKLKLNGGEALKLTDPLPEGTELVTGKGATGKDAYSLKDQDGKDVVEGNVSYDALKHIITVTVPDEKYVIFNYQVMVDNPTGSSGRVFENTATLKGNGIYTDTAQKKHVTVENSGFITGDTNSITIKKVAENDPNTTLPGAKFQLYTVDLNSSGESALSGIGNELSTDSSGIVAFQNLSLVEKDSTTYKLYCFKELEAPSGYEKGDNDYSTGYYFIVYSDKDGAKTKAEEYATQAKTKLNKEVHVLQGGHSVMVSNKIRQTTEVSGIKTWNDGENQDGKRPSSITIRLYANGSEIGHKTVTEKDGWSWNWTDLNRYDTDHKEISYTISEDAVDGYTSTISGYNVTNTVNKPQVGSVILTKVDATTGTALAGAVFDLYRANNTKVGTYTTNAGGVLRVDGLTFGDYYFVETKAPEGYALESQRAAFTINAATTVSAPASVRVTNKPVDEKIGVSAAKVWDDENNTDGVRPSSVTFRLFADGVEIGSAQASEANGWTVSFGNLPKTRNGVAISYAVKEDEVGNYYEASYETGLGSDGSYVFTVKNYRETDKHYEERTGSVRGANRNKPSNGGVAGAGRGRGTGDESDMTVYGTVSGASLLALIVWMIARRKRAGKGTK